MSDIYDTGVIVSSAGRRLQGAVIERATGTDYAVNLNSKAFPIGIVMGPLDRHRIQLRRGPLYDGGRRDEPASADRDVHDGIDPDLVTRRLVGGVRAQLLGAHSRPLSHQCRG
jgi:hypothetical protein